MKRRSVVSLVGLVVLLTSAPGSTRMAAQAPEAGDAVAALAEAIPPPERPLWPPSMDWAEFERQNGFAAPRDYRGILERYGVGSFGTDDLEYGWLYLLDPAAPGTSLVDRSDWDRRNMRGFQRRFPGQYTDWPVWPEEEGFLPWANTIDGDLIGWWTVGHPEAWGTRFFGRHDDFEEFRLGAARFLLRLFTGGLEGSTLDDPFATVSDEVGLRFFPATGPQAGDGDVSRQEATVSFDGLSPLVDRAALLDVYQEAGLDVRPPAEAGQRAEAILEPATRILERWIERARASGVGVRSYGVGGDWMSGEFHHEVSITFLFEDEPTARRLVLELGGELQVSVGEVRDLQYVRIWEDMTAQG